MTDAAEDIKVPLKLRLKAWWEGYDLEDVKAHLLTQQGYPSSANDASEVDTSAADKDTTPLPEDKISVMAWDKLRIQMTQLIWGDGYCGPGGKSQIQTMSKLLAMNSEMSAIVVGAGLGGPARVMAEDYGVWITGYEQSKELVEKANNLSLEASLEKKVVIQHIDPAQPNPFERKFERAFSKEALYCFPDKDKILKDTYDTLKDDALFLLTDYTLTDISALENSDVQKWLKQEASQPFPVTAKKMKNCLENCGFSLRVNEDISQDYVELIERSWTKAEVIAKELAQKGPEGVAAITTLMEEAEFWSLRAKLMKNGLIEVRRFLAHKPNKPLR